MLFLKNLSVEEMLYLQSLAMTIMDSQPAAEEHLGKDVT